MGVAEDIVISIVAFLFLSFRNTDGTVIQGANSCSTVEDYKTGDKASKKREIDGNFNPDSCM